MTHTHHIIRKLIFEVQIPSEEQGFAMQNMISDLFNSILQRELEKLLDEMDNKNEVISINKLEIDLGFIEDNVFEQDVPEKLKAHLEEKLREVIVSARMKANEGENKEQVTIKPVNRSKLDLLLHFLQTGTMPWWARSEERSVSVLIMKLTHESPSQLMHALEKVFRNNSQRKRFIYQLADPIIAEVMKLYDRSFASFAADSVSDICTIHASNSFTSQSSQSLRLACWSYFIQQLIDKSTSTGVTEKAVHLKQLITQLQPAGDALLFVIRKARQMQDEQMLRTKDLADILVIARQQMHTSKDQQQDDKQGNKKARRAKKQKDTLTSGEEQNTSSLPGESEKETGDNTSSKNKKVRKAKLLKNKNNDPDDSENNESTQNKAKLDTDHAEIEKDITGKTQLEKEELRDQLKKAFSIEDNEEIADVLADGIYINNSGLVILWPYILPFFRKLELVNGNEFVNEEARHRAVHILQYLATGEETAEEEHELVLNKLLCGMDPEEPVSAVTSFSEAEKIECEQLLDNIITNWAALKKISASALRSTFLLKEGILKRDNGWSLKIERTTVDMLIDKLPWGISIIKLPWNTEMIYVEW